MSKKKADPIEDADGLVTFTVRLRPSLIKRTKLAAALGGTSMQTIADRALEAYLKKLLTSPDHALLLMRLGKKGGK